MKRTCEIAQVGFHAIANACYKYGIAIYKATPQA